ncbi:MAG: hypothetical protein RR936_12720 [Carnobacterium sp.]|uniref:hypothetical protein n=1 Tax=Carnobacterium sp. TaxID=48221 RepID=UPI002FCA2644
MTDLDLIYSCYKWEIDALVEGRMLAALDEKERNAELAMFVRYAMNEKKVKVKKMIDKKKEEKEIKSIFNEDQVADEKVPNKEDLKKKKLADLTSYFMNKGG